MCLLFRRLSCEVHLPSASSSNLDTFWHQKSFEISSQINQKTNVDSGIDLGPIWVSFGLIYRKYLAAFGLQKGGTISEYFRFCCILNFITFFECFSDRFWSIFVPKMVPKSLQVCFPHRFLTALPLLVCTCTFYNVLEFRHNERKSNKKLQASKQ